METFQEAINNGSWVRTSNGSFKMLLPGGYEIWLERLLFNHQFYLAIYKDEELVTPKVVVKPGFEKDRDDKR